MPAGRLAPLGLAGQVDLCWHYRRKATIRDPLSVTGSEFSHSVSRTVLSRACDLRVLHADARQIWVGLIVPGLGEHSTRYYSRPRSSVDRCRGVNGHST